MGNIEVGDYVRSREKIGKLIRIERDDIDTSLKWYVLDDGKYERYVNKPYLFRYIWQTFKIKWKSNGDKVWKRFYD